MEEYKLINVEGMSKLENDHFATHTLKGIRQRSPGGQ